mgnify:CR=1 FL=1
MPKNTLLLVLSAIAAVFPPPILQEESPIERPAQKNEAAALAAGEDPLERLRERSDYATLDKRAVGALAVLARARWPKELAGFVYLGVEQFSAAGTSHWISIWSHRKTGLEFALIPGERFQMGSPQAEADRMPDEGQHWVTLDPFLIARTECTQEAWMELTKEALPQNSMLDDALMLPTAGLSPVEVEAWCKRAGLMLPTEAQWEFMCRAGMATAWASGADKGDLQEFANLGSAECPEDWRKIPGIVEAWHDGYGAKTAPVASYAPNAFGLFDVHGNVSEWTRDHYVSYDVPAQVGTGLRPGLSGERMARGGNFGGDATTARSAKRFKCGAGTSPGANKGFGFRPSLDLPFPISLEGWPAETFPLPPGFAPTLPSGTESLRFAPGWRDPKTEDFWSYAFVMWIDEPVPDSAHVGELLNGYYDGILSVFARNAGKDIGSDPVQVKVTRTAPNMYEAQMHAIDAFATFQPIDIRVLVDVIPEAKGPTTVHVRLSPQPKEHRIWRALEAAIASIEKP